MMETMIPPQVGMRLRTKKIGHKKEKAQKKMREKERKGNVTILFPHLCFKVALMFFMIESLLFYHFHILVGFFIIELGCTPT